MANIIALSGVGKMPYNAGLPVIAQTVPWELTNSSGGLAATGVMLLSAIYLNANLKISNINAATANTAANTPTHFWFALYDDGRGSSVAGQVALLAQTADQLTAAIPTSTNIGLALSSPITTQYSGIYYIGAMVAASVTVPTWATATSGATLPSTFQIGNGTLISGTAGSSLTTSAPNPSGTITGSAQVLWAYVS